MSSRLDLLKKGTTSNNKHKDSNKNPRGGMLEEKTQKSKQREDELTDEMLSEDYFENELEDDTPTPEYSETDDSDDEDDSNNDVNVIEIDLDNSEELGIDPSLIEDEAEEEPSSTKTQESSTDIDTDVDTIVEAHQSFDYSEEDIKLETEYTFEHRDQLYNTYVKIITNGGLEVGSSKPLQLDDIIRISVTLTELKEQVGCEARVASVFSPNLRSTNKDDDTKYRYIVQFIGPNAPETERVLSKYLLGYKAK